MFSLPIGLDSGCRSGFEDAPNFCSYVEQLFVGTFVPDPLPELPSDQEILMDFQELPRVIPRVGAPVP